MCEPYSRADCFAPPYYPRFRCVADRCRHSCCIDWEICIDEGTLHKYRPLSAIMETVTEGEDGACFALCADGRCPHLDERGLCRIILAHGEDYLSDICRRHPRFFNRVGDGRVEVGLGLVCEEACRLILTEEAPFSLVRIEDVGLSLDDDDEEPTDFDPLPGRARIMAQLNLPGRCLDETLNALRGEFGVAALHTPEEWIKRFLSLEILDAAWESLLHSVEKAPSGGSLHGDDGAWDIYYARLLTYFVYRHVSVAWSEDNMRARLGFAMLSVEMIRYLFETGEEQSVEALAELARRYSAEIEYSEDNTDELIFAFECRL